MPSPSHLLSSTHPTYITPLVLLLLPPTPLIAALAYLQEEQGRWSHTRPFRGYIMDKTTTTITGKFSTAILFMYSRSLHNHVSTMYIPFISVLSWPPDEAEDYLKTPGLRAESANLWDEQANSKIMDRVQIIQYVHIEYRRFGRPNIDIGQR